MNNVRLTHIFIFDLKIISKAMERITRQCYLQWCFSIFFNRVKELKGQEGQGERKSNTTFSPKYNQYRSNSSGEGCSVITRGKSPPKRPKVEKQRLAFCPTSPTTSSATGGAVLCSTPKSSRWAKDTSARAKKEIGLEHITPIRGMIGIYDKEDRRVRAGGREAMATGNADLSNHGQNVRTGRVLGRATVEQSQLWGIQRDSRLCDKEKHESTTLKGERKREGGWMGHRAHVEKMSGTCCEAERGRDRYLQKADEKDNERERHLKQYHQQLQQFMPSSASLSDHLFSPSTCPSSSASSQASLSSSFTPRQSSHISVSALVSHDLEKELDTHRARGEARADDDSGQLSFLFNGEPSFQTEASARIDKYMDEVGHSDSGGTGEDLRVSLEDREAEYAQNIGEHRKQRLLKATDRGQMWLRTEDLRPAVMDQGAERRWACGPSENKQTGMMTGARRADALVSYNCDSSVGEEGPDASAEHHLSESPCHQAAAEQPLSLACEHTKTLLTPDGHSELSLELKPTRCTSNTPLQPLQNVSGVPLSSCGQKDSLFAANANGREISDAQLTTLPLTTPTACNGCNIPAKPSKILSKSTFYTQGHSHPELNAKMSASVHEETSTDSLSYTIDPLSISLLQVDPQVATASFLQGKQSSPSICPETVEELEDVEFHPSLLEPPEAKTHHTPASDVMAATDQLKKQKQDHNEKPQTTLAIKVPACRSTFVSVQHCRNTGLTSSQPALLMTVDATQTPPKYAQNVPNLAFPISKPQSERVLGWDALPKQCQAVHPNHSGNSNISLQQKCAAFSNNEKSLPILHLSTLEDLYRAQ